MVTKNGGRSAFGLTISRQYGAWSMLVACFLIGALVGSGWSPRILVLLPAVVFGYMTRYGAGVYLRSSVTKERRGVLAWTAVYSALVLVAGGALVFVYELWMLLPLGVIIIAFGVATVVLSQRKMDTTTSGELVGILGLTLVAPAAEYVSSGVVSTGTVGLWLLCAFFFCGSVFHVRYLVRRRSESIGPAKARMEAGWPSLAYHLVVLCISLVLAFARVLPSVAPAVLIPTAVRASVAVGVRFRKPVPVRRIGMTEVLNTIVFLVLTVLIFRYSWLS
jgi:hypothetical protein